MNIQRYAGGKGASFRKVLNLMPPHEVYIETHLGGGAVFKNKRPAGLSDIGIDINPDVVNQWKAQYGDQYNVRMAHAHQFLTEYSFIGNELVFVDPPYITETRIRPKIYAFEYNFQDHEDLLNILVQVSAKVIISGYPHSLYDQLLHKWNKVTYITQTQSGPREERLWFNYDPPEKLHDYRFLGKDFREREQVRRKLETLQRKVLSLQSAERQAFLQWLRENCDDMNIFNSEGAV